MSRKRGKAAQMHQQALERLKRARETKDEYFRVRVDQGVNDAFAAWESAADEPPAAASTPAPTPAPDAAEELPEDEPRESEAS